ncbi:precorrin-3B synthase [Natronosporangium hydrolyticum]|uniref:Precorrin-3B synthase n=1 Tax=Natronosporangium hydrolyticum TaxID=2811111 RepID=A0A895YBR2_9ACTN|nr:precorrin-3B synthase [Natronosporangium hydrolyticum]QSB12759.1 precorrin-3B synthase [Natronosporangium hydrolyticum]
MSAVSSASPRDGGDRCPGALRAHQAADGALVRVRIPGGRVTSAQLRRLSAAARRDADGTLELTSRGNLQLRGISDEAGVGRLAGDLAEIGLLPSVSHERVRNLIASPLSGLDQAGHLDIRRLVRQVDAAVCGDADLAHLSGRFLIALDDGRGDVTGLGADLCWTAGTGALLVAGADLGLRIDLYSVPDALVTAARAFLAVAAGRRDVWRVADLPGAPAAIVASLGGPTADPVPAPRAGPPRLGGHRHGFVVAMAPLGRLTAAQADAIADHAATGELVTTPWRSVVVPTAAPAADLAATGLIVDPASPWVGVTACTGRPGCASALADVRADATAVLAALAAHEPSEGCTSGGHGPSGVDDLPLHWAGCDRVCGRPAGPVAVAVATGAGYRVAGPGGEHHGPLPQRLAEARRPR